MNNLRWAAVLPGAILAALLIRLVAYWGIFYVGLSDETIALPVDMVYNKMR